MTRKLCRSGICVITAGRLSTVREPESDIFAQLLPRAAAEYVVARTPGPYFLRRSTKSLSSVTAVVCMDGSRFIKVAPKMPSRCAKHCASPDIAAVHGRFRNHARSAAVFRSGGANRGAIRSPEEAADVLRTYEDTFSVDISMGATFRTGRACRKFLDIVGVNNYAMGQRVVPVAFTNR